MTFWGSVLVTVLVIWFMCINRQWYILWFPAKMWSLSTAWQQSLSKRWSEHVWNWWESTSQLLVWFEPTWTVFQWSPLTVGWPYTVHLSHSVSYAPDRWLPVYWILIAGAALNIVVTEKICKTLNTTVASENFICYNCISCLTCYLFSLKIKWDA